MGQFYSEKNGEDDQGREREFSKVYCVFCVSLREQLITASQCALCPALKEILVV